MPLDQGNRLATACVFLNVVILLCELEFIGLYNGFKASLGLGQGSYRVIQQNSMWPTAMRYETLHDAKPPD